MILAEFLNKKSAIFWLRQKDIEIKIILTLYRGIVLTSYNPL